MDPCRDVSNLIKTTLRYQRDLPTVSLGGSETGNSHLLSQHRDNPRVLTYTLNPSKSEFEARLVYRGNSRLPGMQWWCHTFNLNLDVKQLSEEGI